MVRWVAVAVLLGLAGCVGQVVPSGQVYSYSQGDFARLQRIVEPLLLANADLCRGSVGVERASDGREFCAIGVAVKKSTEFNAWTDGRTVFVSSVMMAGLPNDGMLAGVISHEIGHILKGHIADKKPWVFAGAFVDGVARGQGINTDGAFQKLGSVVFNKGREREADRIGAYLMARANYAPESIARFWAMMPAGESGWFASHPPSPERAATALLLAQEIAEKQAANEALIP